MRKATGDDDALREIAARVLPGSGSPAVARMTSGTSTPVYRIHRAGTSYYLRLAERAEANLAPEALVHDLLRDRGVRAPEVVHFEPFNQDVRRSIMVTTEVPGCSLAEHHRGIDVARVAAAAGRDLAIINGIAVAGFGFARRERLDAGSLAGEFPTLRAFALGDLETHLAVLPMFLDAAEIEAVRRIVTGRQAWLDTEQATLAHGDLDATHIFHCDGEYTGIIDFGEIRGADPLYDLGHVAIHDDEKMPVPILPHLVRGYGEIAPLPPDHGPRIRVWSLLIGVRTLARSVGRPRTAYQDHLAQAIRKALRSV